MRISFFNIQKNEDCFPPGDQKKPLDVCALGEKQKDEGKNGILNFISLKSHAYFLWGRRSLQFPLSSNRKSTRKIEKETKGK